MNFIAFITTDGGDAFGGFRLLFLVFYITLFAVGGLLLTILYNYIRKGKPESQVSSKLRRLVVLICFAALIFVAGFVIWFRFLRF